MTQSAMRGDWHLRSLAEVATLVDSGVRNFDGLKSYVKTGDVQNDEIVATREVTFEDRPSRANMEVESGDVLCARMKGTQKVILITLRDSECLFSTGFAVFRPKPHLISSRFLMYYMKSSYFQAQKDRRAQGATQKAANNSALEGLSIPVPTLDVQGKVSDMLERAENLRHLRDLGNQLADRAVRSVFLAKFGDPLENPQGWTTEALTNLCDEIYRYPTFYGFQYKPQGIPVVRIGNILGDGRLDHEIFHYVFIDPEVSEKFPRTILRHNDIVMAVRGDGSTGKIGRLSSEGLVGANISPNLIRIKADYGKIHPLYLYHVLASDGGQALIRSRITRTAKKKLTATELKTIEIPVPPIHLQETFARVAESLDRVKEMQKTSSEKARDLHLSLMNGAFGGGHSPVGVGPTL